MNYQDGIIEDEKVEGEFKDEINLRRSIITPSSSYQPSSSSRRSHHHQADKKKKKKKKKKGGGFLGRFKGDKEEEE